MVYMGSKNKISGSIVPIIQKAIEDTGADTYIEPFVGGANIIDKINCEHKYGYDNCDTLIALLDLASKDFSKVMKSGSRELWDKGKAYRKDGIMPADMTLAEIGAMEFFASYSNGGFPRGYAKNTDTRDYYNEAYHNLKKQAPNLKDIVFKCQNYWELEPVQGAVIYCDPPYQGTKQYGYANAPKFDYERFWNWVREISKDNYVLVSEQSAPDDFEIIWTKDVKRTTNKTNDFKATEHLYKWKENYQRGNRNQISIKDEWFGDKTIWVIPTNDDKPVKLVFEGPSLDVNEPLTEEKLDKFLSIIYEESKRTKEFNDNWFGEKQ